MKPTVLDAHALLAYLQREPGFETVRSLFADAAVEGARLLMTSVNMGEVFYIVLRERGPAKLAEIEELVEKLPLEVVVADLALAKQAASLKASKRMSYADCFAAALARMRGGEVVTGDPEFRAVEKEISVHWL
jgi:ribonuclease VapC